MIYKRVRLVGRAWIVWYLQRFNGAVVVQGDEMFYSPMSDIRIGLEGSRVAVHALIVPLLKDWRNEGVRGEEDHQDHQEETDVEQRMFSWAG